MPVYHWFCICRSTGWWKEEAKARWRWGRRSTKTVQERLVFLDNQVHSQILHRVWSFATLLLNLCPCYPELSLSLFQRKESRFHGIIVKVVVVYLLNLYVFSPPQLSQSGVGKLICVLLSVLMGESLDVVYKLLSTYAHLNSCSIDSSETCMEDVIQAKSCILHADLYTVSNIVMVHCNWSWCP